MKDGRELVSFGPLPKDWAKWRGLYVNGKQVILSYTVGKVGVLELPGFDAASGAFTRTDYSLLTQGNRNLGSTVVLQPRDQYSAYASYRHSIADDITAGLGAGVYGRSSAAIDMAGKYWIGPAVQTDLNGFLTIGKLDLNLGVRNLFDRSNYQPTIATVGLRSLVRQAPSRWNGISM